MVTNRTICFFPIQVYYCITPWRIWFFSMFFSTTNTDTFTTKFTFFYSITFWMIKTINFTQLTHHVILMLNGYKSLLIMEKNNVEFRLMFKVLHLLLNPHKLHKNYHQALTHFHIDYNI